MDQGRADISQRDQVEDIVRMMNMGEHTSIYSNQTYEEQMKAAA